MGCTVLVCGLMIAVMGFGRGWSKVGFVELRVRGVLGLGLRSHGLMYLALLLLIPELRLLEYVFVVVKGLG